MILVAKKIGAIRSHPRVPPLRRSIDACLQGAVHTLGRALPPRLLSAAQEGDVMVIRMVDQFVSGIVNLIGMLFIP